MADTSTMDTIACPLACEDRAFLDEGQLQTHVEIVHPDHARQFSAKQRKQAAQKGQAQKDGSYPIKNATDLKNAIQAFGRSKNKAATKAHIIRRARALGLTKMLPKGWVSDSSEEAALVPYVIQKKGEKHCVVKKGGAQVACHDSRPDAIKQMRALYANEKASLAGTDVAHEFRFECYDEACDRQFLELDAMIDHAEAVHTFSDIEKLLREAVREKYYVRGDYKASPPVPSTWAWVEDTATDWVVFLVEKDGDSTLYKASYSITDGAVTLGEPTEVKRRTVYEPVKKES